MLNANGILYEDNYILVCHKPAGIATQTARIGQADMVSEMENYLARNLKQGGVRGEQKEKQRDGARGRLGAQPHIHVINRLDQPVEGILVFAKQSSDAAVLCAQAAGEDMEKEYLALVCDLRGEETAGGMQSGILTDHLLRDGKTNLSRVVPAEVKGAKEARLSFEILREEMPEKLFSAAKEDAGLWGKDWTAGSQNRCAVVRIRLYTGRHHQIRVQMANAGMPLLGDRKYADRAVVALSDKLGIRETALCAYRLSFYHPRTKERLHFESMPKGTAFQRIRI